MENYSDLILEVTGAFDGVRDAIKKYLFKYQCHLIDKHEVNEIADVCQKIQKVFQTLNWENSQFDNICIQLNELIIAGNQYEISNFICGVMLEELDECSNRMKDTLYDTLDKRVKRRIRVKFVDFYGEFNPREHWLYKILETQYIVEESDTPDYLFFSCFGTTYLQYDCIRIFISNEAIYPNLNLYDYAITYSDFKVADRVLPNQDAFEYLKYRKLAESRQEAEELLASKKKFCNFVSSNAEGDPFQRRLFEEICEYKAVTAGGSFLNNTGYLVDDLEDFQGEFKFSIACENSCYKGYTTEKIINAFNAKTIPIYWGNEDVTRIINPKAIINCHDFASVGDIVEEIKRLDTDEEAYIRKLMQPILVDVLMPKKYLEEREKFIINILEQPYEKAIRRNTGLRGQWYNDWFCHMLGYRQEWFTLEKGYFMKLNQEGINNPLVSILIPVYNRKYMVKDAINAALSQTYVNTEIIVVDNCSTDGTYEELLARYGENTKVKLYENSMNIGPVNNWKACLEKANGKYIKILWSDDLIRSDFVEKCVEVMEKDDTIGVAYSTCLVFDDDNLNAGAMVFKLDSGSGSYDKDVFYKGLLLQDKVRFPYSPGCAMFRREDVQILDEIPNDLGLNCNANGAGIDVLIYLKALEKHQKFYYFDEMMSYFRSHSGSISVSNNLIREYNLAKLYFCKQSRDANKYIDRVCMNILRYEGITTEEEGMRILKKYGYEIGAV